MIDLAKLLENIDPALKKEAEEEGTSDEYIKVFTRLAPKLWYSMFKEVPNTNPSTLVTASLYATAYLAALPKEDIETVKSYKEAVVGTFSQALDDAFEKDDLTKHMSQLATVGQLNLYKDLHNENTVILKKVAGLLERLENKWD